MRNYLFILVAAAACSGGSGPDPKSGGDTAGTGAGGGSSKGAPPAADSNAGYAPLEVGADYQQSFTKLSTEPFVSPTHGKRYVEVWVNETGVAAYQGDGEFPVGTVIVKESWERDDSGARTEVRGPLFVMEKKEQGFDSEHNDWWYALHWENVPDSWQGKMGAKQVYWRSPSEKVDYCSGCHDNYDREVGLPAKGYRAWEEASE